MEIYKRETEKVVKRFLRHQISFSDCIAALDVALATLITKRRPEELPALRAVMLANNERVMKEMERLSAGKKAEHAEITGDGSAGLSASAPGQSAPKDLPG
jgi:hypothetical protein